MPRILKAWMACASCGFVAGGLLAADVPSASQAKPPGFTHYTQTIPGSTVTFEMVTIPGGEMVLGSQMKEPGRDTNDLPAHKVTIKPFWMGKLEVGWEEFLPFAMIDMKDVVRNVDKLEGLVDRDGVSHPTRPYGSAYRDRGERGYPALGMSLSAAMEYCRWLSRKTGLKYRLPTEEEWEYACRAGSTNAFFWGDDPARAVQYGWFNDNSLVESAGGVSTHSRGQLKPNPFGLYDIVGNVGEWCQTASAETQRVLRGGAYDSEVAFLRCAARRVETPAWNEYDPQSPQSIWWLASADFTGFRVVRSFDDKEQGAEAARGVQVKPIPDMKPAAVSQDISVKYKQYCANCHGVDGKGDTKLGRLKKARDYTSPAVKATLDDKTMFKAIKEGLTVDGQHVMKAYGEELNDAEIEALIKMMKSL